MKKIVEDEEKDSKPQTQKLEVELSEDEVIDFVNRVNDRIKTNKDGRV